MFILLLLLLPLTMIAQNDPNFHIEVEEIEKTESFANNRLGMSNFTMSGKFDLDVLLAFCLMETNKKFEKNGIQLNRNPFLKIKMTTRVNCNTQLKAQKLLDHLVSMFDLAIDSTMHTDKFVIITSLDNFEKHNGKRNFGSGLNGNNFFFSGSTIDQICRGFRNFGQINLMYEGESSEENFEQLLNYQIEVEKLNSIGSFTKELDRKGITYKIENRDHLIYKISNR